MATPIAAAGAYANVARITSDPALALAKGLGAPQPSETSFSSVLKDAIGAVNELGQKSDAQTRNAVNGKANMVDVVTAVSETEVAIDAVVAVRDRVIQAYEDIMKMPI
jgi:flagellar hook-basal body complex protein FliE